MMEYSYISLLERMEKSGNNLADVAIGRMMDMVYEESGVYPEWSDKAPEWVVKQCIG